MVGPLLSSKHRLPSRRPGAVSRQRLAGRLEAASRSALTVLSAPAGFGKTTLLAEWLAAGCAHDAAVAWLSLDRGDNEPALFWTYVVTAMQTAVEGIGSGALQVLASSSPPIDAALAVLVNDLDGMSTDLVLVLDDYHLVETPFLRLRRRWVKGQSGRPDSNRRLLAPKASALARLSYAPSAAQNTASEPGSLQQPSKGFKR